MLPARESQAACGLPGLYDAGNGAGLPAARDEGRGAEEAGPQSLCWAGGGAHDLVT